MTDRRFSRALGWVSALLLFWVSSAVFAQDHQADPPGRVAHLTYRQGEVVYAPSGEDEWVELPANRPLTNGDRLWTDKGGRAELQLGGATVHINGESHLGVSALDEHGAQLVLEQGTVNARVRDLQQGENFEVDTPNVAVRATQPGEVRIDVDERAGQTRVVVLSGAVSVFGDGRQSVNVAAGQQLTFTGRALAQVQGQPMRPDDFSQFAAERNRLEEQSESARYVPRGVVGYNQLDAHGSWDNVPEYGPVWYPRETAENWAPYRYGRWTYVNPWGWTWVDDAPWGFAPFHYGRWAQIGNRWAWVPGRLAPRPVYSPALVVFLGDGPNAALSLEGGPAVGWYPLAPGEAWWPAYRFSPAYIGALNYGINLALFPRTYTNYYWARRPFAVTAVRIGDFRLGRPVFRAWMPLRADVIARARVGFAPNRPSAVELRESRGDRPRLQAAAPRAQGGQAMAFARQREAERGAGRRDNGARENDRRDNDRAGRGEGGRPDLRHRDRDRNSFIDERQRERQQHRGEREERQGGRGDREDRQGAREERGQRQQQREERQHQREERQGSPAGDAGRQKSPTPGGITSGNNGPDVGSKVTPPRAAQREQHDQRERQQAQEREREQRQQAQERQRQEREQRQHALERQQQAQERQQQAQERQRAQQQQQAQERQRAQQQQQRNKARGRDDDDDDKKGRR